jgi:hypothetical protein
VRTPLITQTVVKQVPARLDETEHALKLVQS